MVNSRERPRRTESYVSAEDREIPAMKPVKKRKRYDDKLRELILYLSSQSEDDEPWGSVKLNKLLFYADFEAYLNFGQAITKQEYFRLENGPAPRRGLIVTGAMQRDGEFAIQINEWHGREQKRPIALRSARLELFKPKEISLIDKIVKRYWGMTAAQMSEESHRFVGWICAEDRGRIPYEIALIGSRKLVGREIEYGLELEKTARECVSGASR